MAQYQSRFRGTEIDERLAAVPNKVDKETGKGLSSNDYTTTEKAKLASLENYDDTALAGRVAVIEGKEAGWDAKQDPVIAGTGIAKDGNTISALPQSAVFVYGEATYQQVAAAYAAGKLCYVIFDDDILVPLISSAEGIFVFSAIAVTASLYIRLESGDVWGNEITMLEPAIEDLDAIRSGAAAGATAYQKPASGIPASDLASGVIPAAQVQSDWNQSDSSAKDFIKNKPTIPDVSDYRTAAAQDVIDSGKLDKVTDGGTWSRLYFVRQTGEQAMIDFGYDVISNGIPKRGSSGQINVPSPSNSSDAANKGYVDTLAGGKADKVAEVSVANSVASQELAPNTMYVFASRSSDLALSLGASVSGEYCEYMFSITVDSNTLPTISGLSGVTWNGGNAPAFALGKQYEISIVNNIGIFVEL